MTEKEQIEYLLFEFLNGKLDNKNEKYIKNWIGESLQNKKEFERYKRIFDEQRRHFPDQDVILSREKLKNTLLQQFFYRKKKDQQIISGLAFLMVIFFGLFIGYSPVFNPADDLSLYAGKTTIETQIGEMSSCILPDSTKIWLNYNSKIQYQVAESTSGKIRQVQVTGEAFFDVAKNKKIPFEVYTSGTKVKVYGTQFNVKQRSEDLEVTLIEGSMAVFTKDNVKVSQLVPGDQVKLDKEGQLISKQLIDVSQIMLWKEGRYEFKDVTLEKIIMHLNELYDVNIMIENSKLKNERFRCVIDRRKSLLQTLQILKETTNLNYEINGSDILLTKN